MTLNKYMISFVIIVLKVYILVALVCTRFLFFLFFLIIKRRKSMISLQFLMKTAIYFEIHSLDGSIWNLLLATTYDINYFLLPSYFIVEHTRWIGHVADGKGLS